MTIPPTGPINVNLAGDLGKPLDRLVEALSLHWGRHTEPDYILKTAKARAEEKRLLADADAYSRVVLAQADQQAAKLLQSGKTASEEIIVSREDAIPDDAKRLVAHTLENTFHDQLREEMNKEAAVGIAAETLTHQSDENVSDKVVGADWMARYFDTVRNISDPDAQFIWGNILAGEVMQPGSYSLRTLETLKNLSQTEAKLFEKASRFALQSPGIAYIFFDYHSVVNPKDSSLSYDDLLRLDQAGLVTVDNSLGMTFTEKSTIGFRYGQEGIILTTNASIRLPIVSFTAVGTELLNLVKEIEIDRKYLCRLLTHLISQGGSIRLAIFLTWDGNSMRHASARNITLEEITAELAN